MTIAERYRRVIQWFTLNMPVAGTELHYESPYQLLVAVILSAQCTDKRVNLVTPALLKPILRFMIWQLPRQTISIHI